MTKKVKVLISGTVECQIHQEVEMDEEQFNRLDAGLDSDDRHSRRLAERGVEEFIDFTDIAGFDDVEIESFQIIKEPQS